jgi:formylmethanofuran dehydrogenase subunit E
MVDLSNPIPKEIVDSAVRFHGHLGPFLILGLKAGLFANDVLGKDYFKTMVIVETEPTPPCSCFLDGIQFVTGCTMGKGNIKLRRGNTLRAIFIKDKRKLRLRLRGDILKNIKGINNTSEEKTLELAKESAEELFEIEERTKSGRRSHRPT